jgi:hypothetical protein
MKSSSHRANSVCAAAMSTRIVRWNPGVMQRTVDFLFERLALQGRPHLHSNVIVQERRSVRRATHARPHRRAVHHILNCDEASCDRSVLDCQLCEVCHAQRDPMSSFGRGPGQRGLRVLATD